MKELAAMWRETRMVMLVAVVAASHAALLIVFAGLVIVPGISSIRPGNAVPVVLGLAFGPAAAWGAGIGNLINDAFTGQLGPASAFGFVGNVFYGLLGYKLWGNLGPLSSGRRPDFRERTGRQLLEFAVVGVAASARRPDGGGRRRRGTIPAPPRRHRLPGGAHTDGTRWGATLEADRLSRGSDADRFVATLECDVGSAGRVHERAQPGATPATEGDTARSDFEFP